MLQAGRWSKRTRRSVQAIGWAGWASWTQLWRLTRRSSGWAGRELDRLLATAVDIVLPPQCAFCREGLPLASLSGACGAARMLCGRCQSSLTADRRRRCDRCAMPLPSDPPPPPRSTAKASASGGHRLCFRCRPDAPAQVRWPLPFRRAFCLGGYQGELRRAIIRSKQLHEHPLAFALGQLLAERLDGRLDGRPGAVRPDYLVPVPKFWVRRISAGFHPAEVIAESLGKSLELPILSGRLQKVRSTRKQSLLGKTARERNLRGAYRVFRPKILLGRHLLLVDDIMTTAATVSEAARTLRRAGAASVGVAIIARA